MNEITLRGNTTAAPRLHSTEDGTACTFTIAMNDRYFDRTTGGWKNRSTVFQDVVVFGDQANNVAGSVTKGTAVAVTGTLGDNSYRKQPDQPAAEPVTVRRTQLVATDVAVSLKNATAVVTKNAREAAPTATVTAAPAAAPTNNR